MWGYCCWILSCLSQVETVVSVCLSLFFWCLFAKVFFFASTQDNIQWGTIPVGNQPWNLLHRRLRWCRILTWDSLVLYRWATYNPWIIELSVWNIKFLSKTTLLGWSAYLCPLSWWNTLATCSAAATWGYSLRWDNYPWCAPLLKKVTITSVFVTGPRKN
jgi:hypothetical protein